MNVANNHMSMCCVCTLDDDIKVTLKLHEHGNQGIPTCQMCPLEMTYDGKNIWLRLKRDEMEAAAADKHQEENIYRKRLDERKTVY